MIKTSKMISAIMTLVLGILFLVLKGKVIGIGLTVLGVVLLLTAILELVKKNFASGVIKAVLAIAVFLIGYLLLDIALIVIAIVLMVYGVLEFVKRIIAIFKKQSGKFLATVLGFINPVLCVIAAGFLLTSRGEAISWAIIVAGVLFVIDGIIALVEALVYKN